jgi:hypothetical protein
LSLRSWQVPEFVVPLQQEFQSEFLLVSFWEDSQQSKTEHGSEHEMKNAYLYHRVSARRHFNTIKKYEKGIECQL